MKDSKRDSPLKLTIDKPPLLSTDSIVIEQPEKNVRPGQLYKMEYSFDKRAEGPIKLKSRLVPVDTRHCGEIDQKLTQYAASLWTKHRKYQGFGRLQHPTKLIE